MTAAPLDPTDPAAAVSPEDDAPEQQPGHALIGAAPATVGDIIDRVLDLDRVMSQARRVERVSRLCLAADLEAEFYDLQEELGELVDPDGNPLSDGEGEQALSEQNRAVEVSERLRDLRRQMRAESYTVRFRGMSASDWEGFEKANRDTKGATKPDYWHKLMVQTAIAPVMTIDQVRALSDQLTTSQINAMVRAAYESCTEGGLDVPKLPTFLHSPKPQE